MTSANVVKVVALLLILVSARAKAFEAPKPPDSKTIVKKASSPLKGIRYGMASIDFSPDGAWLACRASVEPFGKNQHYKTFVWDTTTWQIKSQIDIAQTFPYSVTFAAGSKGLFVAEGRRNEAFTTPNRSAHALSLWQKVSPGRQSRARQHLWLRKKTVALTSDVLADNSAIRLGFPLWVIARASRNGKLIAVPISLQSRDYARNGIVQILAADSLTVRQTLKHPKRIVGVHFLPDEAGLATACEDGKIRIWSLREGELLFEFNFAEGLRELAESGAWQIGIGLSTSSHGKLLAVSAPSLATYDFTNGNRIAIRKRRRANKIAVHPDGKYLFSNEMNNLTIWTYPDLQELLSIKYDGTHSGDGMALSPDGTWLVTGGLKPRVWSVQRLLEFGGVEPNEDFEKHSAGPEAKHE